MKNPVFTIEFNQHIKTDAKKDAFVHNDRKVYDGMTGAEIAQFQAELSAAWTAVLAKFAEHLKA